MLPSGAALRDKACRISAVCPSGDKACPIFVCPVCLSDCTVFPIFPRQVCANQGEMVAYRFFPGCARDHNCAVHLLSVVCLCEDKVYRISAICPISVCPNEVVSLIFARQVCVSRAGMVAYRSFRSFSIDRNCAVRLFSVVCLCDYKVYQISAVSRISAAYPISACPSEVVSLIFPQVRANLCAVIGLRNRSLVCVKLDVVGDSRN
jgi:hypothetical protein